MKLHWVEYIVCTKPVPGPRGSRWSWEKIYDNGRIQFWVCNDDLKEQYLQEARSAFGKSLEQITKLGDNPTLIYPEPL